MSELQKSLGDAEEWKLRKPSRHFSRYSETASGGLLLSFALYSLNRREKVEGSKSQRLSTSRRKTSPNIPALIETSRLWA